MICPRCRHDHIGTLSNSPVPGAWSVFQCESCLYSWRSTEPVRRSDPEHYPQAFRMTSADIGHAEEIPTVPPLLAKPL